MTQLLRAAFAAFALASAFSAAAGTKILRYPDVHGNRVVFTYAGDLWIAPTDGGTAIRLTSHPGLEFAAKFSPDGTRIAFTGQYDGDEQVYVMPVSGGVPQQLSFYPAVGPLPQRWGFDNFVYGWTPDGTSVLYKSSYDGFEAGDMRLFTAPVAGGLPTALAMPVSGAGEFAPDGKRVVYSPLSNDHRAWKRYEGGWAQDLYVLDLDAKTWTNVTNSPRNDRDPVWIGEAIYYLSDRDGKMNLYRYDLASKATTQLTKHRDFDAKWASGDQTSGLIVYEFDKQIRVFDTRTNSERAIEITVPSDALSARPAQTSVADDVRQFDLSSDGARALIGARGELYSVPVEHGITRNLAGTSNAHEREPAFSANGKQIAYVSDADGEEHLYVRLSDGSGTPRKLTRDVLGRLYGPKWSPDDARIAFSDAEGRLHVIDTASGARTEVAEDPFGVLTDHAWSPGGRYLAYQKSEPTQFGAVHIFDRTTGRSTRVTDPMFHASEPRFAPDGEHLFFTSAREFAPQLDTVEWNFARDRQIGIFAIALNRDAGRALPIQNDEAGAATADDSADDKAGGGGDKKTTDGSEGVPRDPVIDFDGLASRVERLPIDAGNIGGLGVTASHIVFGRFDAFYYGREGRNPPELIAYDLEKRSEKKLADKVNGWALSPTGQHVLVDSEAGLQRIPLGDGETKTLDLGGLVYQRVPRDEYAVVFNEVWRRFRDYFYVENMHGYDWNAIRDEYRRWLPYVNHRADLNYLLSDMVGELNVSHAYVSGGDLGLPERPTVGLLGARLELDRSAGRYRIARIFTGQNEEERYRSPLTEVGVDAAVGDYVLAINGRDLGATDNPYQLLRIAPGAMVELTLSAAPSGGGMRRVLVQPIASENELKYLAWVATNRARVAELSDGRFGYLHIPDMGPDGIREFIKWYYPQIRKEGLVIDVRGNGGGNVSQMLIERLRRDLLALDFARTHSLPTTYPQAVFHGQLVALINETSASDGDIFPYMFQKIGLGPLIGKRSWGGVVGITDWGPLIDGGSVAVPQFPMNDLDGNFIVEGHGVDPDIVVENDVFSLIAGRDPQLERGVAELDRAIKASPKRWPARGAMPVKTD